MRLFDPTGLKAKDYKAKYPELGRTEEFEELSGTELIFVWYYANATSPIITMEDDKRVEEALVQSGYMVASKEKFLNLQFGEKLDKAIEKMASFIPGARYFGLKALRNTYDNYIDVLGRSTDQFTKVVGKGDDSYSEEDLTAYSNITAKMTAALPELIAKLEEGFGVSISSSEDDDEGTALFRNWQQDRQKH